MSRNPEGPAEGVAIVGFAGRFPGAPDVASFWRNLVDGVEAVRPFTDEEMLACGVDPGLLSHPSYVRKGIVLEDVDRFDAEFFDYTPRDAEILDPQQRLLLECSWEALENAGHDPDHFPGSVGVFASAMTGTYLLANLYPNRRLLDTVGHVAVRILNDRDFVAPRISYKLNLRGPSIGVQTACSSSLVAVHLACQSLMSFECDMALVGGVALYLPQQAGYLYQEGSILSPDGHCRAFDADARGTVNGSGACVVVLRRLDDALAEGDRIRAVLRGSSVNNDGSLKMGFTAPSFEGQAEVVAAAQEFAEVDPETLGYVEAHGTGTALGDPVEVAALTQVFRERTARKGFCALGSVKSNIGHLDAAAGLAGLIKVTLAVETGLIPPTLNCREPNPRIGFEDTPFYVNTRLREWEANGHPRRAGISSLGVGGTNVHAIVEQPPKAPASGPSRAWQLLLVSARDDSALEAATDRLRRHLEGAPDLRGPGLADLAFTLQTGRKAFPRRRALVCSGANEAVEVLAARDPRRLSTRTAPAGGRQPVFLLSGQGSQHPGMGEGLIGEPAFREVIDRGAERLRSRLGVDLREILFPSPQRREEAEHQLVQTRIAQPAVFLVDYAVARVWMEWGVMPQALLGHSVGEYAAACLSGTLSFEDALDLLELRGRLMQSLPPGAILGVSLPAEAALAEAGPGVALAAVNAPEVCSLAGPPPAIEALAERLSSRGVDFRRLRTSHAFHSPMTDPILRPYADAVARIALKPPRIPWISNVTGTWITAEEATDPGYWARHLRQPVQFSAGLRELLRRPERVYLEVGPGHGLTRLARLHRLDGGDERPPEAVPSLRHPQEQGEDLRSMLTALGRLWSAGAKVDWKGFYKRETRRRAEAPTYPFQRRRCWVDPPAGPFPSVHAVEPAEVQASPEPAEAPTIQADNASSPLERLVAGVWRELLGYSSIGRHDDFFELGGNSLTATRALSRIRDALRIELPVRDLFEAPTVASLAERIAAAGEVGLDAAPAVDAAPAIRLPDPEPRELPASHGQQRFWLLQQINPEDTSDHVPILLEIRGALDLDAVGRTLDALIVRHAALRTAFVSREGEPVQLVLPPAAVRLDWEVEDLSEQTPDAAEARIRDYVGEQWLRPFDLGRAPLLRFRLFRRGAARHVLYANMHHAVSDGWSMHVLAGDFSSIYRHLAAGGDFDGMETPTRYADFVSWQRHGLESGAFRAHEEYWLSRLRSLPPRADLPYDGPARPPVPGRVGGDLSIWIDGPTAEALREAAAEHRVSLNMLMLGAFFLLQHLLSGSEDLVIGTPTAGRPSAVYEPVIGCFVNTLPIRVRLGAVDTAADLLVAVRQACLEAYEHQDYPLDLVIEKLNPERRAANDALFSTLFLFLNLPVQGDAGGFEVEVLPIGPRPAKFDLTLVAREVLDGIDCRWEYRRDRFSADTIADCAERYRMLLEELTAVAVGS